MDCRTGEIHHMTEEDMQDFATENRRRLAVMTEAQVNALKDKNPGVRKRWMKHQPCQCGSGKKMFKCCWHLYR